LELNDMVDPFKPQNVHCDLTPHQQPREVSNGILIRPRTSSPN
jgi:hypothetical protein